MNGTLGLTVLQGGVRAGETEGDTTVIKKCAESNVEELASVIALNALYENIELSEDIGIEALEGGCGIRLLMKGEAP